MKAFLVFLFFTLFCALHCAANTTQLVDKCISYGLFDKQLCVNINETDCTGLSIQVTNQGSDLFSGDKDITDLIGLDGETTLFCGTAVRNCDTCLILKSPSLEDGLINYCFEITTTCSGFQVFDYNFECVSSGAPCDFNCPNGCSGNGVCSFGICQCNDGYAGADCSIFQENQCIQIESDGKMLCASTSVDCDALSVDVTLAGQPVGTWEIETSSLEDNKEFTICSVGATPGCDVCLHMEDVAVTDVDFYGCLMMQFSCYDQLLDLGCQQLAFPADCNVDCKFDMADTVLRDLEVPVEVTINHGEWWYAYFPVVGNIADLRVELNTTTVGVNVDVYERANCRPSPDSFDSKMSFDGEQSPFVSWSIFESCDTSLQGSTAEIYYFGFLCSSPSLSSCSFNVKAVGHYVHEIPVREQSETVWSKGDEYAYFYFIPTSYDPFYIQLDVATAYTTQSSVELSYNTATCPTNSHYIQKQTESFYSGLVYNIRTESFNVTVNQPIPGLLYFVMAKINSVCEGNWCAVAAASVVFQDQDSLPSYDSSYPWYWYWYYSSTTLTSLPDWYSYYSWWTNSVPDNTNSKPDDTNSKPDVTNSLPSGSVGKSSDQHNGESSKKDDDDDDDNTTLIIILSITIPILVLMIIAVATVSVVMYIKYKRATNEHFYTSAIDDDGLRLDDGDFEL